MPQARSWVQSLRSHLCTVRGTGKKTDLFDVLPGSLQAVVVDLVFRVTGDCRL